MLTQNLVFVGISLQLIGQITYVRSIIKGHAKPNLVSWVIWMLAPFIGTFFLLKAGTGLSVLPVFMAGFGPFLVIITALLVKNGFWKIQKFDIYCGVLSVLSLLCYIFTQNLGISIFFAIFSDTLAGVPTIIKSWKFPETESGIIYFLAMVSNIIGLLTLKIWSFSTAAFGIFVTLQCVLILLAIHRKKITSIFSRT